MPLKSGKMRPEDEQKIRRNFRSLKQNIDPKDLTDIFIERGIFDFPDIELINGYNPNTTESRNNCFFQLLFRSGPEAYEVFKEALEANNQTFLIDMLESTPVDAANAPVAEDGAWINDLPQEIRNKRLAERDLSRFSQALGNDWEYVCTEMGLSRAQIDQSIMENPHSKPMQIYSCFNKWRRKEAGNATLQKFVEILSFSQSTTIDWPLVKKFAQQQ